MSKPAVFMGSTREDLRAFPEEVRRVMGVAINDAQEGGEHPAAKATDDTSVTIGSGNIFADLDFANPEEELMKAKLVREIRAIVERRRLSRAEAADLLGLDQEDVAAILAGRTGAFSIDRLVRCLDLLDYTVEVVVRHKPKSRVPSVGAA